MHYFLGVDGGGTKAAYALVSQDGEILSRHIGKGFARTGDTTNTTVAQIMAGVEKCLAGSSVGASHVTGICFGLPCFGELEKKDREIAAALQEKFNRSRCSFTNDCEVGWAGSLACKPGINIVAGTGSIAYGRDDAGKTARAGGWSPFFGDEASCYWLGRKTMELFSKQADRRAPQGALSDIVRREFSLENDFEFIELMERDYAPSRKKVALLQLLLELAATEGDTSATQVYEECVHELVLIISAVASQLDFCEDPFPVSYSGGLFVAGNNEEATAKMKEEHVIEPLRKEIESIGGALQRPLLEPCYGAALCAIRQSCPELLDKAAETMIEGCKQTGI